MTEQYTPSESVVRDYYVDAASNLGGLRDAAFDRFLARVRRDAAREALDGLAAESRELAREMEPHDQGSNAYTARAARVYRDTHYPETED